MNEHFKDARYYLKRTGELPNRHDGSVRARLSDARYFLRQAVRSAKRGLEDEFDGVERRVERFEDDAEGEMKRSLAAARRRVRSARN